MSGDIRDRKSSILPHLSSSPGVYQMYSADGEVLYVGKARNLKKRVSSYFRRTGLSPKTEAMMLLVDTIEVTLTHTEGEALLLENNLIKSEKPRFNIMLRDDKSYPYIFLSDHEYPRLAYHRGAKREKGRYFGPYPSSSAVRESLNLLQKMFGVRQCHDTFFRNRSRPCLQFQLKRCSGPCASMITPRAYEADVNSTVMFLDGKEKALNELMIARMDQASSNLDYETAAVYRDRIAALNRVQETQHVEEQGFDDVDLVALASRQQVTCIDVHMIRGGRQLGRRSYFPRSEARQAESSGEVLNAFLSQYYSGKDMPPTILVSEEPAEREMLEAALAENCKHRIAIRKPVRGKMRHWVGRAQLNAEESLNRRLASRENLGQRFDALQQVLEFEHAIERIECFDISHTGGEATVASCVVFTPDGPLKSDYRRFNIDNVTAGDDYGAMRQALVRRFQKVRDGDGKIPDLLLVDGGKGQIHQAMDIVEEYQLQEMQILGIAKGEGRRAANDRVFLSGHSEPSILPANSPAMHLLQQIRDEAHRFAIAGHRKQRGKKRGVSVLEQIEGVGEKRRQNLLKKMGGLQEVARAGVEDLTKVPGISPALAQKIYDAFHEQDA